jgi:hypothetical protein
MRNLPIDTSRVSFISTGKCAPKAEYVTLSDGSSRRSGNQANDQLGTPLWTVDVLVDDDDAARSEVLGVTIASLDEPAVSKFKPINFRGLTAVLYRDNMSGQPRVSLKAEGIEGGQVKAVQAAAS